MLRCAYTQHYTVVWVFVEFDMRILKFGMILRSMFVPKDILNPILWVIFRGRIVPGSHQKHGVTKGSDRGAT